MIRHRDGRTHDRDNSFLDGVHTDNTRSMGEGGRRGAVGEGNGKVEGGEGDIFSGLERGKGINGRTDAMER